MSKFHFIITTVYFLDVICSALPPCSTCIHRRCHGDGECMKGCTAGHHGSHCNKPCVNCLVSCNRTTGICDQCKPGLFGTYCNTLCPRSCYTNDFGRKYCDRTHGDCLDGCEVGWHGTRCQTPCSEHCPGNQCYGEDGYCTSPCVVGRYGTHCKSLCDSHCKRGCNRHDGHCIGECDSGWSGPFCNNTCKFGWFGTACRSMCSANCLRSCDPTTGICDDGKVGKAKCKDGYYGKRCDKTCISCKTCHDKSGHCLSCTDGLYGHHCSKACGKECENGDCYMNGICLRSYRTHIHMNRRNITFLERRNSHVNKAPVTSKPYFLSYVFPYLSIKIFLRTLND